MEQESTLYRQIARQLLQDIYKETYAYGTRLPSLQALCERFSAGRNTIRAALALLEAVWYTGKRAAVPEYVWIFISWKAIRIFCTAWLAANRGLRMLMMH